MKYPVIKQIKRFVLFTFFGVALLSMGTAYVAAQESETPWQEATLVFQGTGVIYLPTVVADPFGYVHVFWRFTPTGEENNILYEQIYYTRGDGESWSQPVDIILADSLRALSALIDQNGKINLIWVTGSGNLYFSQVNVEEADKVRSWSKPSLLATAGQYPHIHGDTNGRLFIIFPDRFGGVSYLLSMDSGESWSATTTITPSSRVDTVASTPFLAVGDSGIMHVVWTEFLLPNGWPPVGVFYSQSKDNGKTWSPTLQMAGDGYDQINLVSDKDGVVHVAWNGMAGIYGRYHKFSIDDGQSWSETNTVVSSGATSGPPGLVIDRSGTLHLVTTYDGAWYSRWEEPKWTTPVLLSQQENLTTKWIEEPSLSLGQENLLHAVYFADRQRIWYVSKQIDIPGEATVPLPLMASDNTNVTSTPEKTIVTDSPEIETTGPSLNHSSPLMIPPDENTKLFFGTNEIILLSVTPVILIICVIVFAKKMGIRLPSSKS
jgi:hypothetical protein